MPHEDLLRLLDKLDSKLIEIIRGEGSNEDLQMLIQKAKTELKLSDVGNQAALWQLPSQSSKEKAPEETPVSTVVLEG